MRVAMGGARRRQGGRTATEARAGKHPRVHWRDRSFMHPLSIKGRPCRAARRRQCNADRTLVPARLPTHILPSLALINPSSPQTQTPDVANAVLDGVDGFLLGQETLRGEYPIESIRTILAIAKQVRVHVAGVGACKGLRG